MKHIASLIFGVLTLAAILASSGCSKRYDWRMTLHEDGSEPYDLRVFSQLLKEAVGSDQYEHPEYNLLKALQNTDEKTLYVYAGHYPYHDKEETAALRKFIEAGNSVLIINNNYPQILVDSLCNLKSLEGVAPDSSLSQTIPLSTVKDSIIQVEHSQTERKGEIYYKRGVNIFPADWEFYNDSILQLTNARKKLLLNNQYPFGIELPVKNGKFFLVSEAMLFTNYHLRNEDNFKVVNDFMADIVFDAVIYDQSRKYSSAGGQNFGQSPLFYFFKFESFRYAWWTLLAGVLLYLMFNFKRKVKPMPLLPDKSNKSLLYVNTVALMYYKNTAHLQIARMAADVFLFDVRRKYRINTSKLDHEFVESLAIKTQKHRSKAKSLTEKIISLKGLTQLSEDGFLRFFEVLNEFKQAMKQ